MSNDGASAGLITNPQLQTPATEKRYRVVQWATGNVGSRALRRAIEHPQLEVVGCWVHSPSKAGRDVGELAGIAPIGVTATNSIEEVLALKPDCVLYMPHVCDFDEICRILESGANIVSTRMELQNPAAFDPAIHARVQAACRKGNSSVHASGSSPGFISEALPIVLASIQRRLDHLAIVEFADCSSRNSPEMIFEMMGFGAPGGTISEMQQDHMLHSFAPSLQLTATALGLPIDEFKVTGAQGLARHEVTIAAGVIPKDTVAATKTVLTGYRNDKPLITFTTIWFVSSDVETSDGEKWEFRKESGWRVVMMGDCPLDIAITFPVSEADYPEMTPGLTAHRPVNAVPYVCEAPAGIQTTIDLPQIIARLA
jgi:4-hydroxy-tetrahydrodipicolinate reductase